MNLRLMLEEAAAKYGRKTAIVSERGELSYDDLDKASNRIANTLMKLEVEKGDRVAMLLNNSPEFVIIYFGIVKIGAIAVPLDTKYKIDELTSLLADCLPKVLIIESPMLESLLPVLPKFQFIRHVINLDSNYGDRFLSYPEMIATSPAKRIEVALKPEDLAQIAYTSGPSFHPRGIMLPHGCMVTEAIISGEGFEQTDRDKAVLFALPLHHAVGSTIVLLTSFYRGSTVVMLPGLSIPALTEAIEREKVTMLTGVPFIFVLMVREAEERGIKHDLNSLRLCASGGAPLPTAVSKRFKQCYGRDIVQLWGLTETTAHITCQPADGSGELGSVGKPLRGWELKIVDDNGRELPPNQTGEILANGPTMMQGYYHNPWATAEVRKDGWLSAEALPYLVLCLAAIVIMGSLKI